MSRQLTIHHALAISAMAISFSISAQASASRTFVATTGSDSNTAVNCAATTPCRSFPAALSVTSADGEIVVLTSGGYGPVAITQGVTISATGIVASITQVTTGQSAISIGTTGNVTITGLGLHGQGTGYDGIYVGAVGTLSVNNVTADNFANHGLEFNTANGGVLLVYGSKFSHNGNNGLFLHSAGVGPNAYVQNSSFDSNTFFGAESMGGQMTIADSSASNNNTGFLADGDGGLVLTRDRFSFNFFGVQAGNTGNGQVYLADCVAAFNNVDAFFINPGSTMTGSNPGTSVVGPGSGTFTAPLVLK